jgi:hypothetical protein
MFKDGDEEHKPEGEQASEDSGGDDDANSSSITDEDMGMLFSKLREMKEEDVQLDQMMALNWKVGRCEHEVLVKANTEVTTLTNAHHQNSIQCQRCR